MRRYGDRTIRMFYQFTKWTVSLLLKRRTRFLLALISSLSFLVWVVTVTTSMTNANHRRVLTERLKITPRSIDDAESTPRSVQKCTLPKLDPFAPEVMRHVNEVSKPNCDRTRLVVVENGTLVVKAENILSIILRPIERPTGDDFNTRLGERIPVTTHPLSSINNGTFGCLSTFAGDIEYTLMPKGNNDELVLQKTSCYHDAIFQVIGTNDKSLKHALTSKYLTIADSSKMVLSIADEGTRFSSTVYGKLQAVRCSSNQCNEDSCVLLNPKDQSASVTSCSQARAVSFRDASPKGNVAINVLKWDGFLLSILVDNVLSHEYHLQVAENRFKLQAAGNELPNIILLMYDSQSAANFVRKLPQTMKVLQNNPTSLQFEGHTIVGDGTTAQLCAMLTGVAEEVLPEARRSASNSRPIDEWPWIFNDMKSKGYATLYSEEDPYIATFNYRLHGFKDSPTLHYGRPFWLQVSKSIYNGHCLQDRTVHNYQLEYITSFLNSYKHNPKFGLVVSSSVGHNNLNTIQIVDGDLSNFIKHLLSLDNTVLIIFGDHGLRAGNFRNIPQGKLEERLPFFSITFPSWFPVKYHSHFANASRNTKFLTSHFDVYHTMMDLIGLHPVKREWKETGASLFEDLSVLNRTCADAGVQSHWCPCMDFEDIDVNSTIAVNIAGKVVQHINNKIASVAKAKSLCALLELDTVLSAAKGVSNDKVHRFIQTKKETHCDSCVVILREKNTTPRQGFIYQVSLRVKPSLGTYEASLSLNPSGELNHIEISRTNLYGIQPRCIQEEFPNLRKYCFCK